MNTSSVFSRSSHSSLLLFLLRLSATGVLLGRAWQYIFWDGPWRALLWDESVLSGLVGSLGWEWSEWVESLVVERGIEWFTMLEGSLFLLGAVLVWSKVWQSRAWFWLSLTSLLLLHTLLSWKGHFWQIGYLIEHSLQWTAPLWLMLLWPSSSAKSRWWWLVRLAIALTFIGHGLYAMGYHPVPPHFIGMMMNGFGLTEASARQVLWWIGCLDVVVAIGLFLPWKKWFSFALTYIILWGFLTALARIYANASLYHDWLELLGQWLPEFMVRWCHFLIPIALWNYWWEKEKAVP